MDKQRDILDGLLSEVVAEKTLPLGVPRHREAGPTEQQMASIIEEASAGELSSESRSLLSGCPHCREIVEAAGEALAEVEEVAGALQEAAAAQQGVARPDSGPLESRRLKAVLQWASDGLRFLCGTVMPEPLVMQPVAVRNLAQPRPMPEAPSYQEFRALLGPDEVRLQVERLPSDVIDLQVRVVRKRGRKGAYRATLIRKGKVVESVPFEAGEAHFGDLEPDSYILQVTSGQTMVGWLDIVLVRG
jgi:hypothetical protein